MGTVYVFFADGFEEIEAFTTIDVLRRASLNVEMVSITNEQVVTGAHDVPFLTDSFFKDHNFKDAEALVLPGGMPGAATLAKHEGLNALIQEFIKTGKTMAAICAAPMVLGKAGLLKGKTVTCYPGFEQYLEGANCTGQLVEVDGNLITGKGPGAAMDFALTVVDALVGKEKVAELEEAMCIKR
ncbi:MAG: DJ-1/PfpI family protein [Bacteroides sp.]|nr:DJ-1/PfpI family protein [Bacteroides sp.]